jgi:hypothetical protein
MLLVSGYGMMIASELITATIVTYIHTYISHFTDPKLVIGQPDMQKVTIV